MVFVAKESVCGQLGAAFRLRGFSCQRTVESCLILYGIEINENFSVRFDLSSRLRSIEAGGCVRVSRRGRGGAWRRGCTGSEQIDVRAFGSQENGHSDTVKEQPKVCLRCGMTYQDEDNSPIVCKYHGHMTGQYPTLSFSLRKISFVRVMLFFKLSSMTKAQVPRSIEDSDLGELINAVSPRADCGG